MSRAALLLTAVLGVLVTVGALAGVAAALSGWTPAPRRRRIRRTGRLAEALAELPKPWREHYRLLVGAAVVAAVVVWVVTGRPAHGLITFGAVAGLPFLLHPGGSARAEIERLEAMADWLQQLASLVLTGKTLEQAIGDSADAAPAPLQAPLLVAAERMGDGLPPVQAYRLLADDLASQAGDDVVQLFMAHNTSRGAGLAGTLKRMADKVAQRSTDLQSIDADRARARSKARQVTLFTLVVVLVGLASTGYTAWYRTAPGQFALLLLGALIAGALVWLRKTARIEPEPRLLKPLTRARPQHQEGAVS